ncbi:MAG: hypothetical protein ACD_11C00054G0007 [uncultured bacterium]|nr:MAG: hypothetical protein ACD_11C00054G0007 [uncultured bacterium]HBR71987.1 hypothetical protein [Candidatus Moranbacteria bacterium]
MELLHSKNLTSGDAGSSTQKYVDVDEIKDGVIVLKNGSLRSILMVSAINFDLKSTEEQDGIISQYQSFLNSLDFPLQIMISSRKLNIEPYFEYLKKQESKLTNELLIFQIAEYRKFIKNLTEISGIMSKFFYVVVPFSPIESSKGNFIENFFGGSSKDTDRKKQMFEVYKNQLWQRVDHIVAGLGGTGVKAVPLKTEEIIELMYNSYNPVTEHNTLLKNTDKLELK